LFQKERFLAPTAPGLEITEWLQEYVNCSIYPSVRPEPVEG
jgi:hypothetical protein